MPTIIVFPSVNAGFNKVPPLSNQALMIFKVLKSFTDCTPPCQLLKGSGLKVSGLH